VQLRIVQSDPFSGPGLMEAQWHLRGISLAFSYVHKDDPVPPLDGADGLVVMGGRVMPDADAPFLEPTRALMREAIDRGVPVLGVCLGAELLCQATGGDVQELDAPAIGWQALERGRDADDDPIFGDVEDGQQLLGWHSFVLEPPPHAAVLACTDGDVQAVRVGDSAWGVLDHPEQSLSVLGILLAENAEAAEEAGVDPDRLRAETARRQAASAAFGEHLAHRFADQVLLRTR
jgi:GMP synthase-like glutamine amidotransferase